MDLKALQKKVEDLVWRGKEDEALSLLDEAIGNTADKKMMVQLLLSKARIFILFKKDMDRGMENLDLALKLVEDIEDNEFRGQMLNTAAGMLLYTGDKYNAIRFYKKALENLREGSYDYLRVLNNIGEAYKRVGELEDAKKYFEMTYKMAKERNEKRIMIYTGGENIGEIYALQNNWKNAEEWLNKSLKIAEEIDEERMVLYINLVFALVEGKMEEVEKIGKLMKKRGYPHELADAYYYFHIFAPKPIAESCLKEAIEIYGEIKDGSMQNAAIERLQRLEKMEKGAF
ncbi:hypothetical protein B6U71_04060 [Euryarchaeota archaeon ex4484_178]|nr:MAG: hypothetical protein B6U71_04060 [Euryarchaeota archaeon ex4484_178]